MRIEPRRADARRNSERIVRVTIAAFEEGGPALRLDEVADRAGVGVATLYRLFGSRTGLVRAAFETFFAEEVEPLALAAREHTDPAAALGTALAAAVDALAAHRELLAAAREAGTIDVDSAKRFLSPLREVLAAAQRAGMVRDDLTVRDLAAVVVMALATAHDRDRGGADRRRYLTLLLDGVRGSASPLPPPSSDAIQPPA
jgi:AcrR family transcriptional regulator